MLLTPYLRPDFFSIEYGVNIWMQKSMLKIYNDRPILYWTIKNKETAEFIMNTKMPYFRIIDKPILPLDIESNRLLYEILKYILEGLILAIVFSSILSVVPPMVYLSFKMDYIPFWFIFVLLLFIISKSFPLILF